jgi:hypothetical protein
MIVTGSSSMLEYRDGITEVKTTAELKVNGKTYRDTFTGKAIIDWLMNYSTIMEEREAVAVATLFMAYYLIESATKDRAYTFQNPDAGNNIFHFSKHVIYQLAQRAKELINGSNLPRRSSEREHYTRFQRNGLIARMTKAVSQDATMIDTLEEVILLFEEAQDVVFKLMASVSLI